MKKLKRITLSLTLMLLALTPMLAFAPASAQVSEASKNAACEGIGAGAGDQCTGTADEGIGGLIRVVVDILSWITGIASMIMLVIGGFKLITSSGDSSKVNSARSTIIYALIGVAIVVTAQVLVNFVVGNVSGGGNATVTGQRNGANGSVIVSCSDGSERTVTSPGAGISDAVCR